MKKIIKKLFIIFIGILMIHNSTLYAITIDTNVNIGETDAINSSDSMISEFVGVFQVIGAVISILALVIIGIRYMLSSLEEKAKMKGILVYYIIGAILVFATSSVLSIAYNVMTNLK